jgi:hypothetical protein
MKGLKKNVLPIFIFLSGCLLFSDYKGLCVNESIIQFKNQVYYTINSNCTPKDAAESFSKFINSEKDPGKVIDAALYIKSNPIFGDTLSEVVSNFAFQKAIYQIEEFHYSTSSIKSIRYRWLASKLQEQGIPINIPYSNFKKAVINLKQKNYDYLFNRLLLHVKWIIDNTLIWHKITSTLFLLFISLLIMLLIKRKNYLSLSIFILCCLCFGMLYSFAPGNKPLPLYKMEGLKVRFTINNNLEVGVSKITDEGNFPVGKLIWANANTVGFSFQFSPFNLVKILDSIRYQEPLLLCTTASFINNRIQPVGFTMVGGNLINPFFHNQWDGMATIDNKKLKVIPVKDKEMNPTINFDDYFQFTNWLKSNCSEAIQVPLLIYNDSVQFKAEKAGSKMRENRFLLKVTSPQKEEFFLIADIDSYHQLAANTYAIYNQLKDENYFINFMILLDIGANNLFLVYNSDGGKNNHYRSTLPVEKATNILSIHLLKIQAYSIEP